MENLAVSNQPKAVEPFSLSRYFGRFEKIPGGNLLFGKAGYLCFAFRTPRLQS